MPLSPPGPFSDFDFTYDPALSNIFPNPSPLPSSADLFSPDETLDLQTFLDNFGGIDWDTNNNLNTSQEEPVYLPNDYAPYTNPHLDPPKDSSSTKTRSKRGTRSKQRQIPVSRESSSTSRSASPIVQDETAAQRAKPLLSTPQKRLNHIMSEQKRRNAIRDGYSQLIALLAPAGSSHRIGMPTRGRPKGSGLRSKGQTKGKSGVLFRAVEYCQWLEEGRNALYAEVLRVEAAAGINRRS